MRGRNWERTWRDVVGPQVLKVIDSGQAAAAAASSDYVGAALAEFDMPTVAPSTFNPDAFVGFTGGGIDTSTATYQAVIEAAGAQYEADLNADQALEAGERFIAELAASIMADTMRAAEEVAMVQRPWVDGYIRIVEPGACSRCIVLAGKFFLFNEGFLRHPRCRCNHAPAPTDPDRRNDLMAAESPERIFASLTEAEQDKVFGRAGANAIREGADMGRVVNARRGMERAQVYGKDVLVTSTGVAQSRKNRRRRPVRLMPEAIFQIADGDSQEALRLLRVHGYIT